MTSCLLNPSSAARNLTTAVVTEGRPARSRKVLQRSIDSTHWRRPNKDHCTCHAAADCFSARVWSRFHGSCSGPALPPCLRRATTRLHSTPASCCRHQRLQASALGLPHRLRRGLRGVCHRGMARVRLPDCRRRDLLDDLWHLHADQRALAHGPSDARLLHHWHRKHHCTGDVAHRIERVVCQPKGVRRDRCGEHRGIVYLWLNVVGADPEGFRG